MPRTLWTVETAREMGLRSAQLRKERANQPLLAIVEPPSPTDVYTKQRLARVRAQLERIDSMLLKESDPQKLDRLASAQARLSEQERILDGRPLPGSRKPAPERSRPAKSSSPLVDE